MVNRPTIEDRRPWAEARSKPEAKKVRRRRCALPTCNELYRPLKPNQRFCSVECKHEYHFKSETFSKVKREVLALIDREVATRLQRFEVRMLDVIAKMYRLAGPPDQGPICTECMHHGPQRPEASHSNPDCRYAARALGPCIRCGNAGTRRVYSPAPVAEWAGQSQADFCGACYGGPIGKLDAK